MKVKVVKSFRDKLTREAIRAGREIELTEERFSELTAGPLVFVEEIVEEVKEIPPDEEKENDETPPVEKEENKNGEEVEEQPPTDEKPSNEDKKTTKKSTKK